MWWAALLVAVAGLAIGATSIGGVLVVPALSSVGGVPVATAVAAASFGFMFPAVAAFLTASRASAAATASTAASATSATTATSPTAARSEPRPAPPSMALEAGALAGALGGALTLTWLAAPQVRLAVGLLCIGSGLFALAGIARTRTVELPGTAMGLIGIGVGCLSAWSGTGGPVVLLPMLALFGWPVLRSVAAAQRIQLPVAVAASAVHLWAGRLDIALGVGVGVLLLIGWVAGRALAKRLPTRRMQQAVALALIATGIVFV